MRGSAAGLAPYRLDGRLPPRGIPAGVTGFTELDELDDEEARGRAWRDYLSRLRGERSNVLHDLQRARVSAKDLDRAFRTVCTFDEAERGESVAARVERVDAGPAWGSLVHGLLEYAGRHQEAKRDDLERLARWLIVDTPELGPVVADAVELVERARQAPFWEQLQAGEVLVEVPFAVRLKPGELLGGAAADDAGLVARHGRQLATYSAVWERATGTRVTESAIVVALCSLRVVSRDR